MHTKTKTDTEPPQTMGAAHKTIDQLQQNHHLRTAFCFFCVQLIFTIFSLAIYLFHSVLH